MYLVKSLTVEFLVFSDFAVIYGDTGEDWWGGHATGGSKQPWPQSVQKGARGIP